MPGFVDLLGDNAYAGRRGKSRPVSMCSTYSTISIKEPENNSVLFPAAFGVAAGEKFDDVAAVPYGLTIQRIKAITLFFGAWVGTLEVTYLLSDGSEMTRTNGQRGGKSATYQFRPNEILIAVAGLLGFIQNTDFLVNDLMIDYLQFHIKDLDTGDVRIVPEEPEVFNSSRGAEFFIQGPIYAFSGQTAGYLSQIQPYLAKERDVDFGLPAPGVSFDDHKAFKHERVRAMKRITVRAGAWIEGIEVVYELASGRLVTCSHGGTGGKAIVTELQENEVLEAVSVSNSGPFPFCDALRLYFSTYARDGTLISRRTVPDKSSPALGYEYEFGECTWIRSGTRSGTGDRIIAFAGKCGSYIEELACWIRDGETGEERLVKPRRVGTPATARTQLSGDSVFASGLHTPHGSGSNGLENGMDYHRRTASSFDGPSPALSSSLRVELPGSHLFHSSPELILPSSLPSSPSLSSSLRRLSIISTNAGSVSGTAAGGESTPASASISPEIKKRRLSGQIALLRGLPESQRMPNTPERVHQLRTGFGH